MFLVALHLGVVFAALQLGHWPVPSRDDPRGLLGLFVTLGILAGYLIHPFAAAWCAGVSAVLGWRYGWRVVRVHVVAGVFGSTVGLLTLIVDPLGLLDWFWD